MSLYGSLAREKDLSDLYDKAEARLNIGVAGGMYTVVAADDTANYITIPTGFTTVLSFVFEIIRGGVDVRGLCTSAIVGGGMVISDATYAATAGDVVRWIAVGTK